MRLRRGWPMVLFVCLLVAVPIFEVWLLIQVGQQIGLWPTVLILVVEAVLGAWLMRHEGSRAWKALTDAFETGKVPSGELADAALILVGGVLLMLPGFVTDIFGFFFLLPWTRPAARKLIAFFVARRMNRTGHSGRHGPDGPGQPDQGRNRRASDQATAGGPDDHRRRDRGTALGRRCRPFAPSWCETPASGAGHASVCAQLVRNARFRSRRSCPELGRRTVIVLFDRLGARRRSCLLRRSSSAGCCGRRRSSRVRRSAAGEPLSEQVLQFGDRAAFPQHVPVRTHGLLFLHLGSLAVGAERLGSAARAFPQGRDLGLGREDEAEVVLPRAVVADLLPGSELHPRFVLETLGSETCALQ